VNTLTAAELKRRGMAAIEERLRRGPVHLVKRNKAAAVVLTEEQYEQLAQGRRDVDVPGMSAIQWLLSQPVIGTKSRRRLDRELRAERESWA
jgi:PHD/YefM family antitoxin component YafN of YafNO toxin-antitoxin module